MSSSRDNNKQARSVQPQEKALWHWVNRRTEQESFVQGKGMLQDASFGENPISSKAKASLPDLIINDAQILTHKQHRALKKGHIQPEAVLDLHEMTVDEAYRRFKAFIACAVHEQKQCILVITGKGRLSTGGGVLRRLFPQWCQESQVRCLIKGIHHAPPARGGHGAWYIFLRKTR